MKIIISGASGLVGQALTTSLSRQGHEIIRLVRSPKPLGADEASWNPAEGQLDPAAIDGADAVINLNGRNIGAGRWTPAVKDELRTSRLDATRTLVQALGRCEQPPRVLINASATGFYGERGDEEVDEQAGAGEGFLADLAREWEEAALEAQSETTRVVLLRFGMILANDGALKKMLTPFKLGAGGPIGSGRQYWPWIDIDDVCGITAFVLEQEELKGPINAVAPEQVRCKQFTSTLGRVLGRPAIVPLPAFAARLALGEMADGLLLASTRVRPAVLEQAGYTFRSPDLETALKRILGR
jgi:uncharacterized protein (TIGR01777 family)